MKSRWLGFLFVILCLPKLGSTQAVGGNTVFNFLTLPASAKATALGGINISRLGSDIGLAFYNPALLSEQMDGQVQISIKPYYADIQQYNFSGVNFIASKNVILGWGLQYMDYGTLPMTDIAGNNLGQFRPTDYAMQVSAAIHYQQNLRIASTIKFIQSNYGIYKSNGIAIDLGINFISDNNLNSASIVVNNFGQQFKKYQYAENLPFNMVVGYSKKLATAPFQFSITAQHLSKWNTSFNDVGFNTLESIQGPSSLQNVFNHIILGSEISLGKQFEIDLGYNFLRRNELNIQNQQNYLNGISAGFSLHYNRVQVQYANAFFQQNLYHHFTIAYSLKNK